MSKIGTTADDWKKTGNEEFGKGHYSQAIDSYTTALSQDPTPEESLTIRNNRLLAYLKDGRLDEAVSEGVELSSIPQTEEKAMLRTAQAHYELGNFAASAAILSRLCQKYPTQAQAQACLERVKSRQEEQQTGKYNFPTLNKEAASRRPPELDHATFVGPVKVKNSPGRGRGLFTVKAVKAGDLLLCEKSFAHAHKEYTDSSGEILGSQAINEHLIRIGAQAELVGKVVAKASKSRSFYERVTNLYHGNVHRPAATDEDGPTAILDPALAKEIVRLNGFSSDLITREKHIGQSASSKIKHYCTGLWLQASLINHCCLSNARRAFIGDFLIVHATRDLAAGTEVTFTYNRPNGDGEDMQAGLSNWGFTCVCAVCADWNETAKAVKTERKRLLADLEHSLTKSIMDADAAEVILKGIGETYSLPPAEVPRFPLFAPYMKLAAHYREAKDWRKCLSAVLNGLAALGFVLKETALSPAKQGVFTVEKWGAMVDDVVGAFVLLWNVYWGFQHLRDVDVVGECGRTAYKICVGENETFIQSYGGDFA